MDIRNFLKLSEGDSETVEINETANFIAEFKFLAPITGTVTLTKFENSLSADFSLHVQISDECVRCLEPIAGEYKLKLNTIYLMQESEDVPEDGRYFVRKGVIDIREPIRQELFLSLSGSLCRASCQGLCPECGINWNEEKCVCEKEKEFDKIRDRI